MDANAAYAELVRRSQEVALLASTASVLGWDEQTYLPRAGAEHRGEQLALLAGLQHERATDPRIAELLERVEGTPSFAAGDSPEAANTREWRRRYDRAVKLPRSLVEALARATTLGQKAWVEAKKLRDFEPFRGHLESIITLKQDEARCLTSSDGPLYDALLDDYEPGARSADLATLFVRLRRDLVALLAEIRGASLDSDDSNAPPVRSFPIDRQRIFAELVASAIGFDFEAGRLDTAEHPFCSGIGPGDCRLTTRYNPSDFSDGFFSVLHEVGHGLYEQGLDRSQFGTPMGEAVSLGIHESQSRLWENAIGRGKAFWKKWFPLAVRLFPGALRDTGLDTFLREINRVRPSLIRVEADEVTYNLHILIRFELEQALISGDLPVMDLPAAWNAAYCETLGIGPDNDAEGCLQDIHWSAGLIGYFPTYSLGNVHAAQLMRRVSDDRVLSQADIEAGDYAPLLRWLRDNIHRHGQRYRARDLIERVTGSPPDPGALIRSLTTKYSELDLIR